MIPHSLNSVMVKNKSHIGMFLNFEWSMYYITDLFPHANPCRLILKFRDLVIMSIVRIMKYCKHGRNGKLKVKTRSLKKLKVRIKVRDKFA